MGRVRVVVWQVEEDEAGERETEVARWERVLTARRQERVDAAADLRRLGPEVGPIGPYL